MFFFAIFNFQIVKIIEEEQIFVIKNCNYNES